MLSRPTLALKSVFCVWKGLVPGATVAPHPHPGDTCLELNAAGGQLAYAVEAHHALNGISWLVEGPFALDP